MKTFIPFSTHHSQQIIKNVRAVRPPTLSPRPLPEQEKLEQSPKRDIEGMGVAEIKYGDSLCFIMHVATGLWLSYQAPDVKSARLGPLKRRVSGNGHKHKITIDQ